MYFLKGYGIGVAAYAFFLLLALAPMGCKTRPDRRVQFLDIGVT